MRGPPTRTDGNVSAFSVVRPTAGLRTTYSPALSISAHNRTVHAARPIATQSAQCDHVHAVRFKLDQIVDGGAVFADRIAFHMPFIRALALIFGAACVVYAKSLPPWAFKRYGQTCLVEDTTFVNAHG